MTNRLANSTSPYLQHAANPGRLRSWGSRRAELSFSGDVDSGGVEMGADAGLNLTAG